jgi:large repetitive protein
LNGYVANNVFSNVPVGNHTIYAKHTNGCIKPVTFTIEDRKPITAVISHIDVLCKSGTDGKITLSNISGGFGTFEYAVSPSTTFIPFTGNTVTITGLSAQSYTILIRNTGTVGTCSISLTDTIGEPTLLTTALANPTDPVSCYGSSDASFDVSFAGGTAPYKVKLNNSSYVNANNLSGANTHLFSGLAAGNYTVTVQDAHLCTVPVTLIIASGVLFDPVAVVTTLCVNDVTTNKVVIETNSPSPLSEFLFSVDLLPLQLSNVFGPLTAGPHSFKVTHQDGCVKTGVFVMSAISQVALSLADGGLNEIIATASGGSGGYTYTLNGVYYGNQNTFIISQTGAYTVVVTDSNGCTAKVANFNKVFIDIFIPNFFTPDGQGNNNVWGPTNTSNYPNMVTYIFDRYGRKVATLKEGEFWNGKYDGIELPTGDYWYVVKLQGDSDSREFVGNFTLYR